MEINIFGAKLLGQYCYIFCFFATTMYIVQKHKWGKSASMKSIFLQSESGRWNLLAVQSFVDFPYFVKIFILTMENGFLFSFGEGKENYLSRLLRRATCFFFWNLSLSLLFWRKRNDLCRLFRRTTCFTIRYKTRPNSHSWLLTQQMSLTVAASNKSETFLCPGA